MQRLNMESPSAPPPLPATRRPSRACRPGPHSTTSSSSSLPPTDRTTRARHATPARIHRRPSVQLTRRRRRRRRRPARTCYELSRLTHLPLRHPSSTSRQHTTIRHHHAVCTTVLYVLCRAFMYNCCAHSDMLQSLQRVAYNNCT